MSDYYDPLLDRLTRRLRIDPELCCEVREELRSHLEEAQQDFAEDGQSAQESRLMAMRALGDEHLLAEQLWNANCGRIRWRRWLRRGLLVAMLPLAIWVTLWPWWDKFIPHEVDSELVNISRVVKGETFRDPISQWILLSDTRAILNRLKPEERFLFLGDPQATTPLERARSIRDRWPQDPVLQAHYVRYLRSYSEGEPGLSASSVLADLQTELQRGRRLDPDNAYWDLFLAGILAEQAVQFLDEKDSPWQFRVIRRDRTTEKLQPDAGWILSETTLPLSSLEIRDQEKWEQLLQALDRAREAKRYDSYVFTLLDRQLAVVPSPRRLNKWTARASWMASVLLPELSLQRGAARVQAVHALHLAEAGHMDMAMQQLMQFQRLNLLIGSKSVSLVELLSCQAVELNLEQYRGAVYQHAGMEKEAQASLQRQRKAFEEQENVRAHHRTQQDTQKAATFMALVMPAISGYKPDLEPLRTAEQASTQRVFLAAMLLIFDGLLWLILVGGLGLWWVERRTDHKTPMLWIGWSSVGRILGWGVFLPVVGYVIYILSPWSGREFGIQAIWPRMLVEHGLLLVLILLLVIGMGRKALHQRAQRIGLAPSLRVLLRGLTPLLTAAVLLMALAGHGLSQHVESRALARASGAAALDLRTEVSESNYRFIRQRMAEQAEQAITNR